MTSPFTDNILDWYATHSRCLPWRGCNDPYAVWISEIMLQQTRVETVIPYYIRWMEHFPTVKALAEATIQEVLSLWEGLGYYGRAHNLYQAAQIVVSNHDGELPANPEALRRLPGVGHYTAGAIASIAFGLDEPALDGNIRRVLARIFNLTEPARSPLGERTFWQLAREHLPPGKAGAFNQALMDLGATVCTPRAPDCQNCPVRELCLARALGVQEERPIPRKKPATPHYVVTAAVIRRDRHVLIAQRPLNGLLGGLWEFPGGKVEHGEDLAACLQREIQEELGVGVRVGEPFGVYRHAYTHFRVIVHAFLCALTKGAEPQPLQVQDLRWVTRAILSEYPMGKIDRQIANRVIHIMV